jgi:hypothetical protein
VSDMLGFLSWGDTLSLRVFGLFAVYRLGMRDSDRGIRGTRYYDEVQRTAPAQDAEIVRLSRAGLSQAKIAGRRVFGGRSGPRRNARISAHRRSPQSRSCP